MTTFTAEVHRLDLAGDRTWRPVSDMNSPRSQFSTVVHGGDKEIFAFPSYAVGAHGPNTVEVYDIDSDTWTMLALSVGWSVQVARVADTAWITVLAPVAETFILDLNSRQVNGPLDISSPGRRRVFCIRNEHTM